MMGLLSLARREGDSAIARSFAHAAGVAMLFLLFIQSNEWLMKLYSLSSRGAGPGLMTRMNTYCYDYRGGTQYSSITLVCLGITMPIPS
jgi:hypothetical protein